MRGDLNLRRAIRRQQAMPSRDPIADDDSLNLEFRADWREMLLGAGLFAVAFLPVAFFNFLTTGTVWVDAGMIIGVVMTFVYFYFLPPRRVARLRKPR